MRASAAGLLAQMARTESNDVSVQTTFPFFRVERAQPYLRTALDQLLTGFRLETNNIALGAITAAIAGFIPDSPKDLARKLYRANFEMQDELLSLLAKLFVMNGIKFNAALFKDPSISSVWEHAESLTTPFPQYALKDLAMTRRSVLRALFTRYGPAFTSKHDPASLLYLQDEFRVLCQRLDRNVSLLCAALKESHWEPADEKSFKFSFLVGGDLEKAELSHLDLSHSQMTRAKLTSATMTGTKLDYSFLKDADLPSAILKNASLFGAHLEGADLEGADVSDAAMGKVTIDEFTQLEGCKWWKADLRGESWKEEAATDFNLAAELFKRSGESIQSDLTDVHFSVRDVLPELRALSAADGD
jgi:Pentapeptide repeats (8 copies)